MRVTEINGAPLRLKNRASDRKIMAQSRPPFSEGSSAMSTAGPGSVGGGIRILAAKCRGILG